MLYTIVPEDLVYANVPEVGYPKELLYLGRKILALPLDQRRCQIVQLLSNDPEDFLVPAFSPGVIIDFP